MVQGFFQPIHLPLLPFLLLPFLLLIGFLAVIIALLARRRPGGTRLCLSSEERFQRLDRLKEQGLISDDEYQTTRQRILGEL